MKRYVIIAGVNGAGKSTLYNTTKNLKPLPRVNTDEIVREIGSWKDASIVMEAGKIAVKRIEEYLLKGESFNQETTLCGHSILNNIERAKKLGYRIELIYVGVDSVEIAKQRIAKRVADGGHGIPDADVSRRYYESFDNLKKIISKCDLVSLCDNTQELRRFAIYKNGTLCRLSKQVPVWYNEYVVK